jgi:hypothetical protein
MKTNVSTQVYLDPEELDWLDKQMLTIKKSGWRHINRSMVVRSMIRAQMENGVKLDGVSTEEELTNRLISET